MICSKFSDLILDISIKNQTAKQSAHHSNSTSHASNVGQLLAHVGVDDVQLVALL